MNKHIQTLADSGVITNCTGPWGSLLFLAPKPYQEDCNDVDKFVWILCVRYRSLNGITRIFEFPIPRCADSIEELRDSCGVLFIISLDARSGYHQIRVRKCDQEKLTLYTPDSKKKTYTVVPFGPKNAPVFNTAMMQILRDDWTALFNETRLSIIVEHSPNMIICDKKIVIDDILIYYNHTPTLLHYFSCVAKVFTKFRLSFNLFECDFFKSRVEFVGHDLTAGGNCPAQSKINLITEWTLPIHGTVVLSFIVMCAFYSRYCP